MPLTKKVCESPRQNVKRLADHLCMPQSLASGKHFNSRVLALLRYCRATVADG